MINSKWLLTAVILLFCIGAVPPVQAQFSSPASAPISANTIPETQQMQTADLARILKEKGAERPLLLQVGSRVMFAQAHIPESRFAGPGSDPAGLQLLEKTVNGVQKSRLIVIYCGCCPWNRCPNMGPAYKRLRDLGFSNVKALYIPRNFGDDWVAKGYPVEKGN